jgi:hypothetical protein
VEHARAVGPVGVAPFTIVDVFKTSIVCETRFHRQALIGVSKYTGLRCEQVAMRTALCVQSSGFDIPWEHTRLAASVWDHIIIIIIIIIKEVAAAACGTMPPSCCD